MKKYFIFLILLLSGLCFCSCGEEYEYLPSPDPLMNPHWHSFSSSKDSIIISSLEKMPWLYIVALKIEGEDSVVNQPSADTIRVNANNGQDVRIMSTRALQPSNVMEGLDVLKYKWITIKRTKAPDEMMICVDENPGTRRAAHIDVRMESGWYYSFDFEQVGPGEKPRNLNSG